MQSQPAQPAESRELRLRKRFEARRQALEEKIRKENDELQARLESGSKFYELHLHLRFFAILRIVTFLITFSIGAIVTFTATDYHADMDKIYRFTDKFNPCIFMDHYPANLFAMLGLALTVLSTLGYNMVLMLRLHLVGNVWLTTFSSWIIIFVSVIELVFINVFPANLYVMDGDHHHPVDSEGFRIFPAINDTTATDVTLDSLNFTRVEIEALTDHTVFFILWVLSNFVLAGFHFRVAPALGFAGWKTRATMIFAMVAAILGASGMINYLLARGATNSWPVVEHSPDGETGLQKALVSIRRAIKASAWFWIVVLCYPVSVPKSIGVRLTFMIAETGTLDSPTLVRPARIIGLTFRMLGVLLLLCFFFQDPTDLDDRRALSITSGFTTAPYSYFFAPTWLLVVCVTIVGVLLTAVQQWLVDDTSSAENGSTMSLSPRVKMIIVVGGLCTLFEFLCLWIAIPQFKNSGYISCPAGLLLVLWVVVAYDGKNGCTWCNLTSQSAIVLKYGYATLLLGCMVLSALHAVGIILLVVVLFAFEYAVPTLPGLIVEFEALSIKFTTVERNA